MSLEQTRQGSLQWFTLRLLSAVINTIYPYHLLMRTFFGGWNLLVKNMKKSRFSVCPSGNRRVPIPGILGKNFDEFKGCLTFQFFYNRVGPVLCTMTV